MKNILRYYPNLSEKQIEQLTQLGPLYKEWNDKINVISRKDIDNLYQHHVLHSLVISNVIQFNKGSKILDLGTGGGFPGIPLAILFPEVQFTLIDGTRKKITVVNEVASAIGLENVNAQQIRAEELKQKYDFVICRAVASLDKLINWSFRLLSQKQTHGIPNGLITLKGGNIKEEIKALPRKEYVELYRLSKYFSEEYFEEKYVVYVQG